MILGQVKGSISKKRQIAFPKEFRAEMGQEVIVTKGINTYLHIIGKKNWEVLLEGTKGKPFTDKATRDLQRYLFGNAKEVHLDQQGRMLLPEYLVTYAKLKSEVIFIGVERYVELWDKEIFYAYDRTVSRSAELLTIDLSKSDGHE